jgi:hypothetical protein
VESHLVADYPSRLYLPTNRSRMNDPVSSALQAPPPRYLLESDSSDEEGQGEYAASSSRRTKRPAVTPNITGEWVDTAKAGVKEVIIGLGQAGRYLRRKIGTKKGGQIKPAVRVLAGQEELGLGTVHDGVLVLALDDAEGEESWSIARELCKIIKGDKW